jgi:hypothetical protein
MFTAVEDAINLYQTSSLAFPEQAVLGVDMVAFSNVPEEFKHETPGINNVALAQLLLMGAGGV